VVPDPTVEIILGDSLNLIVSTPTPHSGQLNITISTLVIAVVPKWKLRVVILDAAVVSSSLAHMSPSSPLSEEMLPSKRTLEVGFRQLYWLPVLDTLVQCPTVDDPFILLVLGEVNCAGNT
jgi:hypothetical protein